jgi:hypothetical protein
VQLARAQRPQRHRPWRHRQAAPTSPLRAAWSPRALLLHATRRSVGHV